MANSFVKPTQVVQQALALLERELVLPNLCINMNELGTPQLNYSQGFLGRSVSLKVPARLTARDYEWRTRNNPIVVDELEETVVDVSAQGHAYSAVSVTDEERTLDITNFGVQVTQPQISAVARKLEASVANVITDSDLAETVPFVEGTDDPYNVALKARNLLDRYGVPEAGRVLLVGSDVEYAILTDEKIRRVDAAGTIGQTALADATITRLAGLTVIKSLYFPSDFAVAMHRTAFAFANVAPVVPEGVASGAAASYNGLAMRQIFDYDSAYLRDRSVISSFYGVASVEDGRDERDKALWPGGSGKNAKGKNVRAVRIEFTPAAA